MAERVGFVRLRPSCYGGISSCQRAIPPKRALKFTRARRRMAERVGFELFPRADGKELKGITDPRDPPDPHESRDRDTY
jgi:hypothetical protein